MRPQPMKRSEMRGRSRIALRFMRGYGHPEVSVERDTARDIAQGESISTNISIA